MSTDALDPAALIDEVVTSRTISSEPRFDGAVWKVRTDLVDLGDAGVVDRDVLDHPGAVAIAAVDEDNRVVLVRQYRHPVSSYLWELPAGMRDVHGEAMVDTAKRELAEEAGLQAERWFTLLDLYKTSGGSNELMRIFLARGLSEAQPDGDFVLEHEEADMLVARANLGDVLEAIGQGRIHNAALIAGAMAVERALKADESTLRPADAPWG